MTQTHLTAGVDRLDSSGDACRHPSARDGDEDDVQVRDLLHQLQADGSLARHDVVVVVRVDDDPLRLPGYPVRRLLPAGGSWLAQD